MAAARKVSPAASTTLRPSADSFEASLPIVVVLPEPLTPATRMTNGLASPITSGLATGAEDFRHLGGNHRLHLVRRDALAVDALADHLGDAMGQVVAEVGAHQRVLDHVELGGVHRTLGD